MGVGFDSEVTAALALAAGASIWAETETGLLLTTVAGGVVDGWVSTGTPCWIAFATGPVKPGRRCRSSNLGLDNGSAERCKVGGALPGREAGRSRE